MQRKWELFSQPEKSTTPVKYPHCPRCLCVFSSVCVCVCVCLSIMSESWKVFSFDPLAISNRTNINCLIVSCAIMEIVDRHTHPQSTHAHAHTRIHAHSANMIVSGTVVTVLPACHRTVTAPRAFCSPLNHPSSLDKPTPINRHAMMNAGSVWCEHACVFPC